MKQITLFKGPDKTSYNAVKNGITTCDTEKENTYYEIAGVPACTAQAASFINAT